MFPTRSSYINEDKSYTEIRDELHRAYREKGAGAGVRFDHGRGLYIKNAKPGWRKFFDTAADEQARLDKFQGAAEKLKAAINREYKTWKVNGEEMGEYVFRNLAGYFDGKRLNSDDLDKIDRLIAEGMEASATVQAGAPRHRVQEAADRNAIFEELKNARAVQASQSWMQRFWARCVGDDSVQHAVNRAAERAHNWRAIVHGNRKLCKALADDIEASGYGGDAQQAARQILQDEGLTRTGLTLKSYQRLMHVMKKKRGRLENLQRLEPYVNLTQNAATNIERLRQLNASIEYLLHTTDFGYLNQSILREIQQSSEVVSEAAENLSLGRLSRTRHRNDLYEKLQRRFDLLGRERQSLTVAQAPAGEVRRLAALLDEHLAVTHDLALALRQPENDGLLRHAKAFCLPAHAEASGVAAVDGGALGAPLPQPKELFKSGDPSAAVVSPETEYNGACSDVVHALDRYNSSPSKSRLETLRQKATKASQLNDHLVVAFGRYGVLGGNAHTRIGDQLNAHRRTLQALQLAVVQESGRLAASHASGHNARMHATPRSDLASVISGSHKSRLVKPRPGHRGPNRSDESYQDRLNDGSPEDLSSRGAGGNESIRSSFDDNSGNAGPVRQDRRDDDVPLTTQDTRPRGAAIAPYSDSRVSSSVIARFDHFPDGDVTTPAAGASDLSFGRVETSDRSNNDDSSPNAEEPDYTLYKYGNMLNGGLSYQAGLGQGVVALQTGRPLDALPENAARRSVPADAPLSSRNHSTDATHEEPTLPSAPALREIIRQHSEMSDDSGDIPSDAGSIGLMRNDLTEYVSQVTVGPDDGTDDDENPNANKDTNSGVFVYTDYAVDYDGADDSGSTATDADESTSSGDSGSTATDTDESTSSGTPSPRAFPSKQSEAASGSDSSSG